LQRCVVHFYRDIWAIFPVGKVTEVAAMLEAVRAQESRAAARVIATSSVPCAWGTLRAIAVSDVATSRGAGSRDAPGGAGVVGRQTESSPLAWRACLSPH